MEYCNAIQRGASNSVIDILVLSNPTGAQNVTCLVLCEGIFLRKSMFNMGKIFSNLSCQYLFNK